MTTGKIRSISEEMDRLYGKAGTPEREQFRREAYAYCKGTGKARASKTEKILSSPPARHFMKQVFENIPMKNE